MIRAIIQYLYWTPSRVSDFLKLRIDWVCFFAMVGAFILFGIYFSNYDLYLKIGLRMESLLEVSIISALAFMANYNDMRDFGKLSVWGFVAVSILNTFQVFTGFTAGGYFMWAVATVFCLVIVGYIYYLIQFLSSGEKEP